MIRYGREFFKLSGSGNDFVFVDVRGKPAAELSDAAAVAAVCARATGVGADGIVFLGRSETAEFSIRYLNRDGSLAALCGNAALCGARLAVELGLVKPAGFRIETDAGVIAARVLGDRPEIDLPTPELLEGEVAAIRPATGEQRIGRATVGVPHLVVLCDDVDGLDVERRGRTLRSHQALPDGANVNFVAPDGDAWRIRTYERGVEAETLACGTGAAASALVLAAWGRAADSVRLRTRSGSTLEVSLPRSGAGPSRGRLRLRGPARIVFRGRLGELGADR